MSLFSKKYFILLLFSQIKIINKTEVFFSQSYSIEDNIVFSSNLTEKLMHLFSSAKHRIYIAIYMLTDTKIANALAQVKEQNPDIDIQVLVDEALINNPYGKVKFLVQNNIPVYSYDFDQLKKQKVSLKKNKSMFILNNQCPSTQKTATRINIKPIMHNKYAIIDDLVWTGSFNFTVNANRNNQENVLITSNKKALASFLENFKNLKKHAYLVTSENLNQPKRSNNATYNVKQNKIKVLPLFKKIMSYIEDFFNKVF